MGKKWCVYASCQSDATGRDYSFGDGITSSLSRIYAVCDTKAEAEAALERMLQGKHMQRARIPGDGLMWPELTVGVFDPLDFVGRQNRDDYYYGKRLAALRRELSERAESNAKDLLN